MIRKFRILFLLAGFWIIVFSILLLIYAGLPVDVDMIQGTLSPTLFVKP